MEWDTETKEAEYTEEKAKAALWQCLSKGEEDRHHCTVGDEFGLTSEKISGRATNYIFEDGKLYFDIERHSSLGCHTRPGFPMPARINEVRRYSFDPVNEFLSEEGIVSSVIVVEDYEMWAFNVCEYDSIRVSKLEDGTYCVSEDSCNEKAVVKDYAEAVAFVEDIAQSFNLRSLMDYNFEDTGAMDKLDEVVAKLKEACKKEMVSKLKDSWPD